MVLVGATTTVVSVDPAPPPAEPSSTGTSVTGGSVTGGTTAEASGAPHVDASIDAPTSAEKSLPLVARRIDPIDDTLVNEPPDQGSLVTAP